MIASRKLRLLGLALALLFPQLAGGAVQAATNRVRSVFTALEAKDCESVPGRQGASALRCTGVGGVRVVLEDAGGRTFMTFEVDNGLAAAPAPRSLVSANSVISTRRRRAMIEWRVSRPDGEPIPYAAIVRYSTTGAGKRGEVLVVSKVGAGGSCHIAYVDALANRDAIVMAREIADHRARAHDCANPPAVEGLKGRSPM